MVNDGGNPVDELWAAVAALRAAASDSTTPQWWLTVADLLDEQAERLTYHQNAWTECAFGADQQRELAERLWQHSLAVARGVLEAARS